MSIDIDWENLTTGPSGIALADSIRDFIHDKFQEVQLPRFIRSVHVHTFDFGRECPVVELKDVSDPLEAFYEDEDEDGDGENEEEAGQEDVDSVEGRGGRNRIEGQAHGSEAMKKPTYIDTRLPNFRSGFNHGEQISTPFLSRSSTPGIPGGTSNFSYFHLPLSAGLSGTQTPLAALSPAWQEQGTGRHQHTFTDTNSNARTAGVAANGRLQEQDFDLGRKAQGSNAEDDRSQDLQTTLHISYSGSLSLSLTAEILLDYPMPSFVGIPLKLQITGLSFDGVGVLAYLTKGERRKVHFCFMGDEDAKAMIGGGDVLGEGDEGKGLGGLLKEIRVESEIGKKESGKQVLKNVGKVERFVLEQVRRIFEEELVWPSFWTFLV